MLTCLYVTKSSSISKLDFIIHEFYVAPSILIMYAPRRRGEASYLHISTAYNMQKDGEGVHVVCTSVYSRNSLMRPPKGLSQQWLLCEVVA